MSLSLYNKKRNFRETSEPVGKTSKEAKLRFVVQRHHASHIHYDFRLEMGGTLKSWAVPKGPSLNPTVKRLAMLVEDHPVSYIDFEGMIPKGNYGAGTVEVWDNGTYIPVNEKLEPISEAKALADFKKGSLKIELKGKKIKGGFALVRLKNVDGKNWLLIKHRDTHAVDEDYNSEDYSRHKKKEDKAVTKEPAFEKPAAKKSVKKKSDPVDESPVSIGRTKIKNYIKPMLASVSSEAFDDTDWLFELKLDGYRAIAELGDNQVKLYSRNGLSFIDKYPPIVQSLQKIKHHAILDGEIVLVKEDGKPDFQKLQHYEDNTEYPLVYYVFDILFFEGEDLKEIPLTERKKLLKKLLGKNSTIKYCDHIDDKGKTFYKKVVEVNMEGIIAKKKDGLYYPGVRTKDWLKIKNVLTHEAVIAGYTAPRGGRNHFGALILGKYEDSQLTYIGHTGTGFSEQTLRDLWKAMQPLITASSPFAEKIKVNSAVTWVKPKLVAELNYTEITEEGMMRHPVFVRLRPDQNAKEVFMKDTNAPVKVKAGKTAPGSGNKKKDKETPGTPANKIIVVEKKSLELTNIHKIFWPKEGFTKGDVINYYEKIAPYILPYLKNRPLSLKRNPNGIDGEAFYHKDAGGSAPSWVKKKDIFSESANKTIHYIVCNDKATLLYLANLGCIEMNPWNSTTARLQNPTYMVIDIDPSDKNTFEQVIQTALTTKEILDRAGAVTFCKTSGATGLHVYVPMNNKYDYEVVKNFGHIIASLVQEQLPAFTSLERNLAKRGNKNIYVDFLQNRTGQTLASAYSLRPKEGATVSTPLEWKEVKSGLHPSAFTITNIFKRIDKKGDLFAPVLTRTTDIKKCLKNLGAV
jgi:bifunctional non-homologous end joining protein LigD